MLDIQNQSMKEKALRDIRDISFSPQTSLVIFGEMFKGGYVTGLAEAAKKRGMSIIYSTVGRRTPEGDLRKLTEGECLNHPMVSVPLEAGFEHFPCSTGQTPLNMCENLTLKDIKTVRLDKSLLAQSQKRAVEDFKKRVQLWVEELQEFLPPEGDVVIAHTMAGGVPRAKILLPLLNRVFKGVGERFSSSEAFWNSDLGHLCAKNFNEVTAQSYFHLLELTKPLREELNKQGRQVFYLAYSYHGTEVLVGENYQWQSYAPYLQGFAKRELEGISQNFYLKGVKSCVFNVPEILTKSSAIFPGLQVPLYTLLGALKKEKAWEKLSPFFEDVKEQHIQQVLKLTRTYFESDVVKKQTVFSKWPQHNNKEYTELLLTTSKELSRFLSPDLSHRLSDLVLKSTGRLIFQELKETKYSRLWLGHDVIAKDQALRA